MTAAEKARTAWLDKLGIGTRCQLVGMCHGCITLTVSDGAHVLWFYDYPIATLDEARARYAAIVPAWLRNLYA